MGGIGGGNLGSLGYTINVAGAEEAVKQIDSVGVAAEGTGAKAEKASLRFDDFKQAITKTAAGVGAVMLAFKTLQSILTQLESARVFGPSMADSLKDMEILGKTGADQMKALADEIETVGKQIDELAGSTKISKNQIANALSFGEVADAASARLSELIKQRESLYEKDAKAADAARKAAAERLEEQQKTITAQQAINALIAEGIAATVKAEKELNDSREANDAATIQRQKNMIEMMNEAADAAQKELDTRKKIADLVASQNTKNNAVFASDRMPALFSRMADQLDQINNRMPRR